MQAIAFSRSLISWLQYFVLGMLLHSCVIPVLLLFDINKSTTDRYLSWHRAKGTTDTPWHMHALLSVSRCTGVLRLRLVLHSLFDKALYTAPSLAVTGTVGNCIEWPHSYSSVGCYIRATSSRLALLFLLYRLALKVTMQETSSTTAPGACLTHQVWAITKKTYLSMCERQNICTACCSS